MTHEQRAAELVPNCQCKTGPCHWDKVRAAVAAALADVEKLATERAEREAKDALEDMVRQFAYYGNGAYFTGGLSALEHAFGVLGWEDPQPDDSCKCDSDGCGEQATCGTPTLTKYRWTCSKHLPPTSAFAAGGEGENKA